MLHWSVAAAAAAPAVAEVIVAAPAAKADEVLEIGRAAAAGAADLAVVEGGAERADSVAAALARAVKPIVAVHDAARPLISSEAFQSLAEIVESEGIDGAILATPIFDTIKRAPVRAGDSQPLIGETLDRSGLWAAQTPQVFPTATLRAAYEAAGERAPEATDEATLVEWAGGRVALVPASGPNFKLTSAEDLALAGLILGAV